MKWRKLVAEQARNGETVAVFCRRQGLCEPHHYWWKERLLPKHPMAEAANYTLGQWTELHVFWADGAVTAGKDVSEGGMKRVALSRKNSLFVGK